jgi:hypothetical protein
MWLLLGAAVAVLLGVVFLRRRQSLRHTVLAAAYDYVIVGAGSAGCVLPRALPRASLIHGTALGLAHRLSEDPAVTVLLLEAGGDPRGPPS